MTRTTRTLTALGVLAAVVALADQARHTTCPCGGCGSAR